MHRPSFRVTLNCRHARHQRASDDTNEGDIMIANPHVESGGCRAGIFRHARRRRAATVRPAP
jgi:hypothetical protein